MRTTINLDDEVYERVVAQAVKSFGSTKKISTVINMALKEKLGIKTATRNLAVKDIFGTVKFKESTQKIKDGLRKGWE